jgi:hypothetical protein
MKNFYDLLEYGQDWKNQQVGYVWDMISAEIRGAKSYLEAGQNIEAILNKVVNNVRIHLKELDG